MQITGQQLADILEGRLVGDPDVLVSEPCKIEDGKPGGITFLANTKYEAYIYDTKASVVMVSEDFVPDKKVKATLIYVSNVYASLSTLLGKFNTKISLHEGIASTAVIDVTAKIDAGASIDDYVIIKPGVSIGKNSKIYGHVFIGDHVTVGENVRIFPGVRIYHNCVIGNNCVIHANTVIGSDGFGFAPVNEGQYDKIPQTGNVVIEDDVEVGSNTVIDRATLGSTIICKGVKLDNLIQIGHNVVVGSNTVIAAQTGVAGSTRIGSNCLIGGQVGFKGHIDIADGTMIQAQSGVSNSIRHKETKLYGSPAIEFQNYLKSYVYFKNFPDIVQQIRNLELEVNRLKLVSDNMK
ncbi:MAG: UDP-3-O-(3-hydroxymyristoyl)glucosamine N-acyltransferase [Saprospiraceae bacterium]|nr:UDP-3-O-(3-hydroxymyristoyl)glucosamine N-acyltransferase [Saprospiraceae bacterium]